MILSITENKIEPIKIYILFYILIFPLDLSNWMMSVLSMILLLWWLIVGKNKGYFIKLKEIFYNKPLILFILFILFAYISLLWSDNWTRGFKELNYYKYYWIMIPVLFTTLNKKDIKLAFYALILSFGIYSIYSLLIFLGLFEIKDSNHLNPKGHIAYSVVTAYFALNTIFAFYFYIMEESSKKIKYLLLFISIVSFFALIVNNGRIGQFSFLVTLFVLIFYYRKYLYKYKKLFISIIVVLILGISFLYSTKKLDRYVTGFNELVYSYQNNDFVGSWGPRLFMWYVGKENIPNNLIFGAGVGDYYDDIIEYVKENPNKLKHDIIGYHNQHLDYLAKFGIFGYLIFLSSVFVLLRQLYLKDKYFFTLGIIFFSIVLINSIGNENLTGKPFNTTYALVFILLSIVVHSPNKKNKEK
ncbi:MULTISPECIES: O-antigen ligase family protein [Arcobacteraceae]|uniref:O-antigen ligase family protein n=1 Tax=Arcobacteraceae TaxID=2808963 RepID=UPI000DEBB3BC|nr:O-antigen ligase family protein [Arcobacter sp. CECT 9188]RBQ26204.1 polymerase [Arcobacter sp. CECT 9188]